MMESIKVTLITAPDREVTVEADCQTGGVEWYKDFQVAINHESKLLHFLPLVPATVLQWVKFYKPEIKFDVNDSKDCCEYLRRVIMFPRVRVSGNKELKELMPKLNKYKSISYLFTSDVSGSIEKWLKKNQERLNKEPEADPSTDSESSSSDSSSDSSDEESGIDAEEAFNITQHVVKKKCTRLFAGRIKSKALKGYTQCIVHFTDPGIEEAKEYLTDLGYKVDVINDLGVQYGLNISWDKRKRVEEEKKDEDEGETKRQCIEFMPLEQCMD